MIRRNMAAKLARLSPGSLRGQLLSRSLIILALVLLLIGSFQYVFVRDIVYRSKAVSLRSQVMSVPAPLWDNMLNNNLRGDHEQPRLIIPDATVAFIDRQGNFAVISEGRLDAPPPRLETQDHTSAINQHRQNYHLVHSGNSEHLIVLQSIYLGPQRDFLGTVQVSTPTAPLKELLFKQLSAFLFLAAFALMLGYLAFSSALKKTLVPLSTMVDTAGQIDAGNLDKRFPIQQGQAEIDHLAESCNGMLERLEDSFAAEKQIQEQMRRFIADASHELRTPLTSIHGFLEVLLRGAANQPEELDKSLKSMYSESTRLNKLVHDLLLLTKLDRSTPMERNEVPLDQLINDMVPQLHILAGNRVVDLSIEPDTYCLINADQIKQVILNLFQNAIQYTDAETGNIKVSLSKSDQKVQLSIQDNGPGIDPEHIPHIFDRFYRSDTSRTRKYGGSGLGLAITESIVHAHGGSIEITSELGQGSTFTVILPEIGNPQLTSEVIW